MNLRKGATMKKQLVIDKMARDGRIHQAECERQPLATLQFCLDVMYGKMRHQPDFGPLYLDGLRQAQRDLDHLISLAAGDPPAATKKSSLLRQLAASTEFNAVSKELIAKAEKLERQAEGLKYKFSKQRLKNFPINVNPTPEEQQNAVDRILRRTKESKKVRA
jgi:hypothetical protein